MEKDRTKLRKKLEIFMQILNEKQRRLLLAAEAISLGYGGIQEISEITGVSRRTISKGIKEIESNDADALETSRNRKKGGGRKPIEQTQPGIVEAIEQILEAHTKGDPEAPLLWTSKSLRNLESGIKDKGFSADHTTITRLLKEMGYSLQSNRKELAIKPSHPDRNAQFEYINKMTKLYFIKGIPVLSIDAKKKENIGNFRNNGNEYHKKGEPVKVLDHDFPISEPMSTG
jgi:transposase